MRAITIIIPLIIILMVQVAFGAAFTPKRAYAGFDGTPDIKCNENSTRCLGRTFQKCTQNDWITVEECKLGTHCNYKKGCSGITTHNEKNPVIKSKQTEKKKVNVNPNNTQKVVNNK